MDMITVSVTTTAPPQDAFAAYTTPEDIMMWNAASDDWHTPAATVDLQEGGRFCYRMEARDGSMGFDFEGTYTAVDQHRLLAYDLDGRPVRAVFTPDGDGTHVAVTFAPDGTHSRDQQRDGWQAILDRFARHTDAKSA